MLPRVGPVISAPLTEPHLLLPFNCLMRDFSLSPRVTPGPRVLEVTEYYSLIFLAALNPKFSQAHKVCIHNTVPGRMVSETTLSPEFSFQLCREEPQKGHRFPRCPALLINWKYLAASVIVKHRPDSISTARDNCPVSTQDSRP